MIHQLVRTQFLPAPAKAVWDFFATPSNLNLLTPPELNFETLTEPEPMYAGQLISYRIRLLPGVRTRWLTEITHVQTGAYFVDEQRIGPYKIWHHEHHFIPKHNGVEMLDRVTYSLPFSPLSELVHLLWVRPTLRRIFDFRRDAVANRFGPQPRDHE